MTRQHAQCECKLLFRERRVEQNVNFNVNDTNTWGILCINCSVCYDWYKSTTFQVPSLVGSEKTPFTADGQQCVSMGSLYLTGKKLEFLSKSKEFYR